MTDISTVRTDLLSIVGNHRMHIKTKRILIQQKLKEINTYIDLKPNKIFNLKKRKINKILSILPSIKYNVDLKKLLTQKLITELTNFEKYQDINSSCSEEDDIKETAFENCIKKIYLSNNTDKSNFMETIKNALPNKEILICNAPVKSENSEVESVESKKINESLNSATEEDPDCDEDSDTEEDFDTEENSEDEESATEDTEDEESEADVLDNTVNNLLEDLADDAKAKLIIKLTKYKLEHEYNMEAEKNRNMERMEELAIKKLKIKNKYKLKKLENRK